MTVCQSTEATQSTDAVFSFSYETSTGWH